MCIYLSDAQASFVNNKLMALLGTMGVVQISISVNNRLEVEMIFLKNRKPESLDNEIIKVFNLFFEEK